jgi:hypothetical protein
MTTGTARHARDVRIRAAGDMTARTARHARDVRIRAAGESQRDMPEEGTA